MNTKSLIWALSASAFALCGPAGAVGGVITTVAGDGDAGFEGDGQAATAAALGNNPWSVAVDRQGNLYIADTGNNRIRKIDAHGTIQTVAGNGTAGFSGDGGPATEASLDGPFGVAIDPAGNLYIADTNNHRIREVDTKGAIHTVAGSDTFGFGGDGGPATSAILSGPEAVALDSIGNMYVADGGNNRVRIVRTDGVISTVAGNGASGYNGDGQPAVEARLSVRGIAVDSKGNLYIADEENSRIRKVDADGVISTVAGNGGFGFRGDGGPAAEATLCNPYAVAVDKAGDLFIADFNNYRIRMVNADGVIDTVAGSGIGGFGGDGGDATAAELSSLTGVAVDDAGDIYFPDASHRIRKVARAAAPR